MDDLSDLLIRDRGLPAPARGDGPEILQSLLLVLRPPGAHSVDTNLMPISIEGVGLTISSSQQHPGPLDLPVRR